MRPALYYGSGGLSSGISKIKESPETSFADFMGNS